MGYMTCYSLVVGDDRHGVAEERREEVLGWIERDEAFRHELESFHEHGAEGYAKWYGMTWICSASRGHSPKSCSCFGARVGNPRICGNAITLAVGCKRRPPGSNIHPSIPTSCSNPKSLRAERGRRGDHSVPVGKPRSISAMKGLLQVHRLVR